MVRSKKFLYIFLLSLYFPVSCTDNQVDPQVPQSEFLVAYEQEFIRTVPQINTLLDLAGIMDMENYMRYDINLYTITYNTRYLDRDVVASGIVTFPEAGQPMPMMSFQNGTITSHREAPTENLATSGLISSIASAGYIFLIPDYIGFGSSEDILHPYYHEATTANTVRDMLRAAEELSRLEGYDFNGELFLAGYSEGGYATLATHKSIEENPLPGFELIASAPASGGYDIRGMQEYFFSLETYNEPYYLAYVALSYANTYDLPDLLDQIFLEPFASAIPGLFDGTLTGGEINLQLTNQINDLIQPDLLQHIDIDPKYDYILDLFEENSVHDWVASIPVYLYHGTADVTVPFQNSVDTHEHMLNLGASPGIVQLIPLEGETHGSGSIPYVIDIIKKFDTLTRSRVF
jgi:pimeloyl-ACP methyl ester carboxylesterase